MKVIYIFLIVVLFSNQGLCLNCLRCLDYLGTKCLETYDYNCPSIPPKNATEMLTSSRGMYNTMNSSSSDFVDVYCVTFKGADAYANITDQGCLWSNYGATDKQIQEMLEKILQITLSQFYICETDLCNTENNIYRTTRTTRRTTTTTRRTTTTTRRTTTTTRPPIYPPTKPTGNSTTNSTTNSTIYPPTPPIYPPTSYPTTVRPNSLQCYICQNMTDRGCTNLIATTCPSGSQYRCITTTAKLTSGTVTEKGCVLATLGATQQQICRTREIQYNVQFSNCYVCSTNLCNSSCSFYLSGVLILFGVFIKVLL